MQPISQETIWARWKREKATVRPQAAGIKLKRGATAPHPTPIHAPAQLRSIAITDRPEYSLEAISEYNGRITQELFKAPGFIADLIEYTESTAAYSCITANAVAAYAMTAFLASRKYRTDTQLTPRLYLFALAASGTGKEQGRQVNYQLCVKLQHNLPATIIWDFASGQALEDHLIRHGAAFILFDEVQTLFSALQDRRNTVQAKINKNLLNYYSANIIAPRQKAVNIGEYTQQNIAPITNFGLVLYGTSVPSVFFDAISREALLGGLLSRCFIFEHKDARFRNTNRRLQDIPEPLITAAAKIYAPCNQNGNLAAILPDAEQQPVTVNKSKEAAARFEEIAVAWDNLYNELPQDLEAESARSLFARAAEKVEKLALVFSVSRNPEQPEIGIDEITRAEILTFHSIAGLLQSSRKCGATQYEKDMETITNILSRHKTGLTRSELLKKSKLQKKEFDSVMQQLVEMESVEKSFDEPDTKRQGRRAEIFFLNIK